MFPDIFSGANTTTHGTGFHFGSVHRSVSLSGSTLARKHWDALHVMNPEVSARVLYFVFRCLLLLFLVGLIMFIFSSPLSLA